MTMTLERRVARLAGMFGPPPVRRSPIEIAAELGLVPDEWQAEVLMGDWRRALLACGRQVGKSTTAALLAVATAVGLPGSLTLIVAPTERQSGLLFRTASALYRRIGSGIEAEVDNRLSLELTNGSQIHAVPGKESTIRGYSAVDLLLLDEGARIEDPVFHAVTPMTATISGRIAAMSSPWGQRGWFWSAWSEGDDLWQRWRVPSSSCPRIDPAFLEAERRSLPERVYLSEYEAVFTDADDQYFSTELVQRAISASVAPRRYSHVV